MTDYKAYMKSLGITREDMIETLKPKYPKFGKPTCSMICQPEKYGVCLLPEAEAELAMELGGDPYKHKISHKKKKEANRTKKNQITFRMSDSLYGNALIMKALYGFPSMQDFLEACLQEYIDRHITKGKHEA